MSRERVHLPIGGGDPTEQGFDLRHVGRADRCRAGLASRGVLLVNPECGAKVEDPVLAWGVLSRLPEILGTESQRAIGADITRG